MCPILKYSTVLRKKFVKHFWRVVRIPRPQCVMMSSLDNGDSINLHIAQSLDGLCGAFFPFRQIPTPIKTLTPKD